ncbi:MAG: hypothetical protein M1832_003258 [Thelocarpon impressellum]|nr:MAG: hypothetical protein M1832_003258 [Thelocarpon impressellum]
MNSAVERRNKQVWEALDAENYKQALQLCTKRLKKGEQGDYLHALKAYALTRSAAAGQRQDGLGELRALVDKVPPIVDVDTLNLVQQALVEYADLESSWNGEADIQHHVDALWERAMRARPGDEDLSKQWFFSAFQKEDWKNAQKAAMSLQRSSPQKRAYYFWAIVCSHMLNGFKTEAVKILDSANLGINSTAAKGDWSFVRIKLDLLAEQEMWQVMWDFCESLLEKARQPPQQLDNGWDGPRMVDFHERSIVQIKRKEPKDTSQEGLSTAWTLARINSQKFIFLLRISRRPQDSKRDVLEAFIGSAIEMYKSTLSLGADLVPTDNQPGDDACILAVMGLVHLARMDSREAAKGSSIHLLQAAALLEHLLSRSKHNYQALLMLVRIYILLGAGSVASEVYPRLAIKQIQNDTLSYNILSRISTLHPHTVVTSIKPVDTADLEPELGKALEEGSYDQIEGFSDFGRRVKRSICKAMWHLERHLLGSELSDNRDRKVIPSCEASELPSFEELIRIGPEPKHEWVRVFVLSEQITDGIERGLEDTTGSPPVPRAEVAAQAQRLRDTLGSKSLKNEATAAEFVHLELQTTLADALMVLLEGSRGKNEAIVEKLRDIQLWLTKRLENQDSEDSSSHLQDLDLNAAPKLVGWSFFHDSFLALDGLIGVLSLLKTLAKRPKAARNAMCKEEEGKTQKLAEQLHLSIRSRAARTRNSLSESGVVGGLVDAAFARQNDKKTPVGSAIEDLVGEAWMERFASGVSESWQEALDGILRVKIS